MHVDDRLQPLDDLFRLGGLAPVDERRGRRDDGAAPGRAPRRGGRRWCAARSPTAARPRRRPRPPRSRPGRGARATGNRSRRRG
ncbi:hypothetical protein FTUN_4765 [Frigoriglobus tundricola]|uniref:Uncharacterized protein n=1 Tax=Frigoriglobus tundricola TaxID=2774151 RepID=A0A6M5YUV0_9BACT|nr:hypothetical protein FTUN_4765 [Frigoriglobus tundricola]